jgi:hypothetical protein
LREEQQREGSQYGELIKSYIKDGLIVPMEVTIVLLENAMKDAMKKQNKTRFLIDGFPRKLDQAVKFEEAVSASFFFFLVFGPHFLEIISAQGTKIERITGGSLPVCFVL